MDTFSTFLVHFQGALTPGRHRAEGERKALTDKRLKKHITTGRKDEPLHVHIRW